MDWEVVIRSYMKFWSRIQAFVSASGDFIKKLCMQYAYTLFLKFSVRFVHPNYFFIVLNVSVEFVLIYRLHPVYSAGVEYFLPHTQ